MAEQQSSNHKPGERMPLMQRFPGLEDIEHQPIERQLETYRDVLAGLQRELDALRR
ncbi:hypothetical protein [Bifidobacterium olomucense]|uniref:hypothetical protein n=1 Tax=Bifidobacterium olomucense TaxID=2675324 RepID=UPI00145DC0EF|nr:hypothetical protein [Bifidobacterium sp. DSM 109959]